MDGIQAQASPMQNLSTLASSYARKSPQIDHLGFPSAIFTRKSEFPGVSRHVTAEGRHQIAFSGEDEVDMLGSDFS